MPAAAEVQCRHLANTRGPSGQHTDGLMDDDAFGAFNFRIGEVQCRHLANTHGQLAHRDTLGRGAFPLAYRCTLWCLQGWLGENCFA